MAQHKCEKCGKAFACADNLKRHLRKHNSDDYHECPICHKTFARKDHLSRHVSNHKKVSTGVSQLHGDNSASRANGSTQCDICKKTFAKDIDLRGHMSHDHPPRYVIRRLRRQFYFACVRLLFLVHENVIVCIYLHFIVYIFIVYFSMYLSWSDNKIIYLSIYQRLWPLYCQE